MLTLKENAYENNSGLKKEFLSPKDVAAILDKSKSWVYDHREELGFIQIGKSYIIHREDFYDNLRLPDKKREKVGILVPVSKEVVSKSRVSSKNKSSEGRDSSKRRTGRQSIVSNEERNSFLRLVHQKT